MGELDHSAIMGLVRTVLHFALTLVPRPPNLVLKVWDGAELKNFETTLRQHYRTVTRFKPKSSRGESPETYVVAQHKFKF
jgi:23S rRNA U2552 (ribose-2'-O)-methylase RlmE/FtsJ